MQSAMPGLQHSRILGRVRRRGDEWAIDGQRVAAHARFMGSILGCVLVVGCSGESGESTAGTMTTVDLTSTGAASTEVDGDRIRVPLVEVVGWEAVPAVLDPLASHRSAQVACPVGGWLYEPQGFEINTLLCNYAMFSQPARAAVVPGARLFGVLYHFDLVASEPATAHVALLIGTEVVWEATVEIPGKANVFVIDVPLEFVAPAGTPVYFHLHNHGQNTWTLGLLEVELPLT